MNLKTKLVLMVAVVVGLFLVATGLVQRYVIYPSFIHLDRDEAIKNGNRSQQALQRELHHLGVMTRDWSAWDETYKFAADRNPGYLGSNLIAETFANTRLDLLFIFDQSGDLVWGRFIDKQKQVHLWPEFPAHNPKHSLRHHAHLDVGHKGILLTNRGAMLVASYPIITSDRQGPSHGTLIMGRALDVDLLKTLQEQTGVFFQVWPFGQESTPMDRNISIQLMQQSGLKQKVQVEERWMKCYLLLDDVESKPGLLLRADTKREMSAHGRQAIWIGLFFQLLSIVVIMFVMLVFLKRIFLKPILQLTDQIKAGDLSALLPVQKGETHDEFDVLWQYKNALEYAVDARTQELQEARDAAVMASQAKGDFLATMSHEIRTPMNVIIGFSEVLAGTSLNQEQKKHLSAIQSAGSALVGLISNILDLAKVETGKLTVERTPFKLRLLLDDCLEMFLVMAQGKGLRLIGDVAAQIPDDLLGDPVRLRQILINLIGNAIKFTNEGQVTFRVFEEVRSHRVVVVTFLVEDSGIGIPEEKLQAIFEPFTQADSSNTRNFGGSGLGLTICVRMAEAMGGVVWAERVSSGGTRMYLTLPFLMEPLTSTSQVRAEPVLSPPLASSGSPMQVLVVDDVEDNCQLIQHFLQQAGHRVAFAHNGREAVDQFFRESGFDLIIMDIQMPVMDGYEATRVIRGLETARGGGPIPILAVTAHALVGELERCQEAGCDGFMTKPIQKQAFLVEIDRLRASRKPMVGEKGG